MQNTDEIWRYVDAKQATAIELADTVWGMPELNYGEFRSAAEHRRVLESEGFRITSNLVGIPTALMGESGEGGPVIAFLGEYDALPGLSQEAGLTEPQRVEGQDGNGHGCGHNLLGAGALLAAIAVKDYLAATGIPGRVRYYGCPAEEGGAGKMFMVRDGAFDGVDIAITWHPWAFAGVSTPQFLANIVADFSFTGRAAHAASSPHLGRSALDALELMNMGVNYLREHTPPHTRMHYAVLDAGGVAPNVVQAHAKGRYMIRAVDPADVREILERLKDIGQGAALMTGTSVTSRIVSGMSNQIMNAPLSQVLHENFMRLGPPPFDDADRDFAAKIRETLRPADIDMAFHRVGLPVARDKVLCDSIMPLGNSGGFGMAASNDVGDVSWIVPTAWARGATCAIGTLFHTWQCTAQGKTAMAHKGMVHAAKAMAGTAIDVLRNPVLVDQARADLVKQTGGRPYECPVPKDVPAPIEMS